MVGFRAHACSTPKGKGEGRGPPVGSRVPGTKLHLGNVGAKSSCQGCVNLMVDMEFTQLLWYIFGFAGFFLPEVIKNSRGRFDQRRR